MIEISETELQCPVNTDLGAALYSLAPVSIIRRRPIELILDQYRRAVIHHSIWIQRKQRGWLQEQVEGAGAVRRQSRNSMWRWPRSGGTYTAGAFRKGQVWECRRGVGTSPGDMEAGLKTLGGKGGWGPGMYGMRSRVGEPVPPGWGNRMVGGIWARSIIPFTDRSKGPEGEQSQPGSSRLTSTKEPTPSTELLKSYNNKAAVWTRIRLSNLEKNDL